MTATSSEIYKTANDCDHNKIASKSNGPRIMPKRNDRWQRRWEMLSIKIASHVYHS